MGSSQDKGVGVCRDGIMGYVMPFSKPLAKYNSTVLFVLIFNNLLSAAIWSNLWHAHVSGFVASNKPCPLTFFKNRKGFLCQSKLSFFRRTRLHWNSSRIFGGEKPMEAELYLSVCVIHIAKNLKDFVVSPSYPFLDRRDRIGILQEFLSGKNRWKQRYDLYRVELSLLISYSDFP